ncbi:hypothetical protein [Azohydromonas lata]|uniref:hypothetical protein n=1 Tax=Azohydromonas lata TaxID=45677 RepID=UPI0012F521D8|nr:hypothetical protein [Azohydromonas lata]
MRSQSTVLLPAAAWSTSTVSSGVAQHLHDLTNALEAFLKPALVRQRIERLAKPSRCGFSPSPKSCVPCLGQWSVAL